MRDGFAFHISGFCASLIGSDSGTHARNTGGNVDAFDNVIPPMLYVPVSDHPDGGHTAIVRELSDGRSGRLAYALTESR